MHDVEKVTFKKPALTGFGKMFLSSHTSQVLAKVLAANF